MADSSDDETAQHPAKVAKKSSGDKRLIVVLEKASLETVSISPMYTLFVL